MGYIPPAQVLSPRKRNKNLRKEHDGGEGSWSLATLEWDGKPAVGIRWNGRSPEGAPPSKGNPQSSGHPTWFILPDEIATEILALVQKLKKQGVV